MGSGVNLTCEVRALTLKKAENIDKLTVGHFSKEKNSTETKSIMIDCQNSIQAMN